MSRHPLFALEHSKTAYLADFVLYGLSAVAMAAFLLVVVPAGERLGIGALALAGLASWSLVEYLLHRFILHGVRPFSQWHGEHHQRPVALIAAPTILSGSLLAILVYLPARAFGNAPEACSVTLGLLTGYLLYAITHHATHHWRANYAWLKRRKQWHAMHHDRHSAPGCFGVTSAFWDHVFGTDRR